MTDSLKKKKKAKRKRTKDEPAISIEHIAERLFIQTSKTNWTKYLNVAGVDVSRTGNTKALHIKQNDINNSPDTTSVEASWIIPIRCSSCHFIMNKQSTEWLRFHYKMDEDVDTETVSYIICCPTCLLKVFSLLAQTSVNEALMACTSIRNRAIEAEALAKEAKSSSSSSSSTTPTPPPKKKQKKSE